MTARVEPVVALASALGFAIGSATVAGLYAFYPPSRDHVWPIPTVVIGSAVSIAMLYATAARLDVVRAGDWLVLGYTAALVLAATLVVSGQLLGMIQDHVPENDGVKSVTAWCVQCFG